jgi:hypothetical protein
LSGTASFITECDSLAANLNERTIAEYQIERLFEGSSVSVSASPCYQQFMPASHIELPYTIRLCENPSL